MHNLLRIAHESLSSNTVNELVVVNNLHITLEFSLILAALGFAHMEKCTGKRAMEDSVLCTSTHLVERKPLS